MDFSCLEITTVATALPIKLVTDLASLIKRSTPINKASPSRGMTLIAAKVEAKPKARAKVETPEDDDIPF